MGIANFSSVLRNSRESSPGDENHRALFKDALLMILAQASKSDINIHPVEIETIQQIMQRETGQEPTEAEVRKAARPHLNESAKLRKYLRRLRRQLTLEHKITIVQSLADLIKSDEQINVLEIDFFNRVVDGLRITLAELLGLQRTPV